VVKLTRELVRIPSRGGIDAYDPVLDGTVALVDRGGQETGVVTSSGSSSVFAGFRFPREVISVAVRCTCAMACPTAMSRS